MSKAWPACQYSFDSMSCVFGTMPDMLPACASWSSALHVSYGAHSSQYALLSHAVVSSVSNVGSGVGSWRAGRERN